MTSAFTDLVEAAPYSSVIKTHKVNNGKTSRGNDRNNSTIQHIHLLRKTYMQLIQIYTLSNNSQLT